MPTNDQRPGRTVVRHEITPDTAAQVVDLYVNKGAKLADIVAATGVPRSSIYWILQKNQVDPNRQGTRRAQDSSGQSLKWAMERIEELAVENAALKVQLAEAHSALIKSVNNQSKG